MTTAPACVKIGILDADLGGLRLAAAIRKRWPRVALCYLADTTYRPIGQRSADLIRRRTRLGLDYLRRQGAAPVVFASQTMAAVATEDFSRSREPILIDPVRLAAADAAEASASGRIGVIASRATVDSGVYSRLIGALRPAAQVYVAAVPLLVPLLDEGRESKPEGRMIVKKYLHRLKVRQVDTLILGSSRCGSIQPLIQRKIGLRVRIIDPLVCVMDYLSDQLALPASDPEAIGEPAAPFAFMVTDLAPGVAAVARRLLKGRADPTDVVL